MLVEFPLKLSRSPPYLIHRYCILLKIILNLFHWNLEVVFGSLARSSRSKKTHSRSITAKVCCRESELLQQQKKNKKTYIDEHGKETFSSNSSLPNASIASSSNSSSKKAVEENGLAYSQLSEPIHKNMLPANSKFPNKKGNIAERILHELLQSGNSAQKYMQGSRSIKIDNWILLDYYVQGRVMSTGFHIRALKSYFNSSKRYMSMKQLEKSRVFRLPQANQKFDTSKPMHVMWKGYMSQLLKIRGKNQLAQCLLGADLHGAVILVAECKINTFTGVSGIMIRETAEMFGLVTQDDKLRVVPKKVSVFIFEVDRWKITLQRDKLTSRNLACQRA